MHKLTLALVVLVGILSVVFAADPPAPGSTVGQPQNVTLRYMSVIGANATNIRGGYDSYIDAVSFYYPQGLSWFSQQYNYSQRLGGPGLFTTDSYYDRSLFYNQNNLNSPTNPTLIFGAPNTTTYGASDYYAIDYSANGVYALVSHYYVFFWNYTSLNLAANNGFPTPDAVFGNYSSTTGLNQYAAIGSSESIAVKKSTGEIFVADSDCARILVYPPTVSTGNQQPSYALGQNDTVQCDSYYTCTTQSPTTCLSEPEWITFDCYDGLWVYDSAYFYYFPNGSRFATFTFNGTSDVQNRFTDAHGIVAGPGCGYLTFLADEGAVFVFQVNYAQVGNFYQPTSVNSVLTFGYYYSSNSDYTTTSTLGSVHGAAFGAGNVAYMSDYSNHRIVALNLSSIVSNSAAPSVVVGGSNTATATATSTASAAALSSGASSYPSSTNTPTASQASTSESNTPIPFFFTGASSQLVSWVDLF